MVTIVSHKLVRLCITSKSDRSRGHLDGLNTGCVRLVNLVSSVYKDGFLFHSRYQRLGAIHRMRY